MITSLILSLEPVFSVLAGRAILGEVLARKELLGCALIFAALIAAQLSDYLGSGVKAIKT